MDSLQQLKRLQQQRKSIVSEFYQQDGTTPKEISSQQQKQLAQKINNLDQRIVPLRMAKQSQELRQHHKKIIDAINVFISKDKIPRILRPGFQSLLPQYEIKIDSELLEGYRVQVQQGKYSIIGILQILFNMDGTQVFNFAALVFVLCSSVEDVPTMMRQVCRYIAIKIFNAAINEGGLRQSMNFQLTKIKTLSLHSMSGEFMWAIVELFVKILYQRLRKPWMNIEFIKDNVSAKQWRLSIKGKDDNCYCETDLIPDHAVIRGKVRLSSIEYDVKIDQYLDKPGIYISTENPEWRQQKSRRQKRTYKKGQTVIYKQAEGFEYKGKVIDGTQDQQKNILVQFDGLPPEKISISKLGSDLLPDQIAEVLYYPLPRQRGLNCTMLSRMNVFRGIYTIKAILDQNKVAMTDAIQRANMEVDTAIDDILTQLYKVAEGQMQQTRQQQQQLQMQQGD